MTHRNTKNVQAMRQRRKDAGLIRVEVWAHPDDADLVKALAQKLADKRAK